MKASIVILLLLITFIACKEKKNVLPETETLSIAQKIANAHGFENWEKVSQIRFTFNVDRDSVHFERQWLWNPKTDNVVMTSNNDTIQFNRTVIDSTNTKAHQGFINDKYWLLVPFQLIWDEGTTISEPITEEAPISKAQLNRITLTYSNEGGYTPGDAYDIYFGENHLIKEWVYREGNAKEASIATTFENYKDFNGIKIALDHKKGEGNWNLNFTNVSVIKE